MIESTDHKSNVPQMIEILQKLKGYTLWEKEKMLVFRHHEDFRLCDKGWSCSPKNVIKLKKAHSLLNIFFQDTFNAFFSQMLDYVGSDTS